MAKAIEVPGQGLVEFPDSMTDRDIESALVKLFPKAAQAANAPSGFAMGLTDPIYGVGQLVAKNDTLSPYVTKAFNAFGAEGKSMDDIVTAREKKYEADREAAGERGVDWGRMGGNLVSSFIPAVGVGGKAASAVSLAQSMGRGGAVGALTSAMQPVIHDPDSEYNYELEKLKQIGLGGGLAAMGAIPIHGLSKAAPYVLEGVSNLRNYVPNWLLGFGRPVEKAGENLADRAALAVTTPVRRELLADAINKYNKEIVPGSQPTTAEVISSIRKKGLPLPERANFEARVEAMNSSPFANPQLTQHVDERTLVQRQTLNSIAQGKSVSMLEAERTSATDPIFAVTDNTEVPVDKALKDLLNRPAIREAVEKTVVNARNAPFKPNEYANLLRMNVGATGENPVFRLGNIIEPKTREINVLDSSGKPYRLKEPTPTQVFLGDLTKVREQLKLIRDSPDVPGKVKLDKNAINQSRKDLQDWMVDKSPEYGEALKLYGDYSKIVDRAKVRDALIGAFEDSTGKPTPSRLLKASYDIPKLIKTSTGNPNAKRLGDILTQPETAAARRVIADSMRTVRATKPPIKAVADSPKLVSSSNVPDIADMLARPATITQWALRATGRDLPPHVAKRSAALETNPIEYANLLRMNAPFKPNESVASALFNAYRRNLPFALSGNLSGQYIGQE